jgi:hypothetical protein
MQGNLEAEKSSGMMRGETRNGGKSLLEGREEHLVRKGRLPDYARKSRLGRVI